MFLCVTDYSLMKSCTLPLRQDRQKRKGKKYASNYDLIPAGICFQGLLLWGNSREKQPVCVYLVSWQTERMRRRKEEGGRFTDHSLQLLSPGSSPPVLPLSLSQVTAVMEKPCNCNLGVSVVLSELGFVTLRPWKLVINSLIIYRGFIIQRSNKMLIIFSIL